MSGDIDGNLFDFVCHTYPDSEALKFKDLVGLNIVKRLKVNWWVLVDKKKLMDHIGLENDKQSEQWCEDVSFYRCGRIWF